MEGLGVRLKVQKREIQMIEEIVRSHQGFLCEESVIIGNLLIIIS